MIPLIRQFFHDLLWSPERMTLWLRGAWFAIWQAMGVAIAQNALPIPAKYAPWVAMISAAALLAKAGDRNPTA